MRRSIKKNGQGQCSNLRYKKFIVTRDDSKIRSMLGRRPWHVSRQNYVAKIYVFKDDNYGEIC